MAYYVFDLLDLNGQSLIRSPLDERASSWPLLIVSPVLLSEPLPGSPAQIVKAIKRLKLEGAIAKRSDSMYRPGKRSDDWVKVRFGNRQEFVVGGYRPSGDSFDALIVGYYDKRRLLFAAKVRAGFTPAIRRALLELLRPLETDRCPFADLPVTKHGRWGEGITAEDMAEMQWVKPSMVVEVSFVEWTQAGVLRHPAFVSVRDDKAAREVRRI